MKIEIDTSRDSKEEIKRAIQLLSSLVNGEVFSNAGLPGTQQDTRNIFENSTPANSVFGSIFDAPQETSGQPVSSQEGTVQSDAQPTSQEETGEVELY